MPPPITLSNPPSLVIFDFDGTLFDTHASIAHCIAQTFSVMAPLPLPQPSPEAIMATISTGAGLEDTFRLLQAEGNKAGMADLSPWVSLTFLLKGSVDYFQ